ncbi:LysR family transcriptional regulator [Clostridia bacterium OttesenSCG-928-F22]|nr:LysR family transcriptional regulator [Clostridia bacterium OttesenSCG-928-F22]
MNINHLRYFQEVCKYSNITKAAKELHISQPSVTAAIKDLEKELGFDLFHRINHRIYLTDQGREFLLRTNDFIQEYKNFQSLSMEIGHNARFTIKLGIPTVFSTYLLQHILPGLKAACPNINLEMYEVPTFTVYDMLQDDAVDLSLGIITPQQQNRLIIEPLFTTRLVLSINKNNPLAKEALIDDSMLKNQPFVIVPKGSFHFEEIFKKYPSVVPNILLHSNQLSTITYTLEQDLAASILCAEIFAEHPDIATIPMKDSIPVPIGIMWNKNKTLTNALKSFIDYTKSVF